MTALIVAIQSPPAVSASKGHQDCENAVTPRFLKRQFFVSRLGFESEWDEHYPPSPVRKEQSCYLKSSEYGFGIANHLLSEVNPTAS